MGIGLRGNRPSVRAVALGRAASPSQETAMLLVVGSIVRPRMLHFTNNMLQVACSVPHRVEIILSPNASACSRRFAPTERILYFPAGSGCHCNNA